MTQKEKSTLYLSKLQNYEREKILQRKPTTKNENNTLDSKRNR